VFDLRASAGPSQTQTTRNIVLTPGAITGNTNGFGGGVSFEAGYRVPAGPLTVKPYAGLAWQGLRRKAYTETQQPFGLAYPTQWFEKLTTTLGASFSIQQRFANGVVVTPEFKLGWAHDLRDTTLVSQ